MHVHAFSFIELSLFETNQLNVWNPRTATQNLQLSLKYSHLRCPGTNDHSIFRDRICWNFWRASFNLRLSEDIKSTHSREVFMVKESESTLGTKQTRGHVFLCLTVSQWRDNLEALLTISLVNRLTFLERNLKTDLAVTWRYFI